MRAWVLILPLAALSLSCGGAVTGPADQDSTGASPVFDGTPTPLTTNALLLTASTRSSGGGDLSFVNIVASSGMPCDVSRAGSCLVQDCRGVSDGAAMGASAGEVDLTRTGTTLLRVAPAAGTDLYPEDVTTKPPWSAGDSLSFVAAGAVVPAFSVPLTSPSALTLTTPISDGKSVVTYNASQDVDVGWQKVGGEVSAQVVQTNATHDLGSTVRVLCEWAGAAGSGRIPASILGLLSTDASLTNTIEVGGSASVDLALSGYWVHVALMNVQSGSFNLLP